MFAVGARQLGNLGRDLANEGKAAERAAKTSVTGATGKLKSDLRAETAAALGTRVGNAWRSQVYAEPRRAIAASMVWTRALSIVAGFDEGATIRPRYGKLLAVPTQYAGRVSVVGKRGSRRPTPDDFREAGIDLRYIPPGRFGRYAALVSQDLRVTGRGARYGTRTKKGNLRSGSATLVIFWLIPQVKLPKKLNVTLHADAAQADLDARLVATISGRASA